MTKKRKCLFIFLFAISLLGVYRFATAYTSNPSNYNIVGLVSSIFVTIGYIILGLYYYKKSKGIKNK